MLFAADIAVVLHRGLVQLQVPVAGLLRASRYASIGTHGVRAAVDGHQEILDAVKARNPQAARDAMLRHLRANEAQLKDTDRW